MVRRIQRVKTTNQRQQQQQQHSQDDDDQQQQQQFYFGANNHATVDDEGINSNEVISKVASLRRKLARRGHTALKNKEHIDESHSRLDYLKNLQRDLEERHRRRCGGDDDNNNNNHQYRSLQSRFAEETTTRGSPRLQGYGSVCQMNNVNNNNNNNCGGTGAAGTAVGSTGTGATPSRRLSLVHQVLQHAQQSGAGNKSIERLEASIRRNIIGSADVNNNSINNSRQANRTINANNNKQYKLTFCEGSESRLRAVRSMAQDTLLSRSSNNNSNRRCDDYY